VWHVQNVQVLADKVITSTLSVLFGLPAATRLVANVEETHGTIHQLGK
jgi:hypothetical protein